MSMESQSEQAQHLLNQIVHDFMQQQKSQRRWRWLKRMVYIALLSYLLFSMLMTYLDEKSQLLRPHVGIVDLKGEISDRSLTNADAFSKALDRAYKNETM